MDGGRAAVSSPVAVPLASAHRFSKGRSALAAGVEGIEITKPPWYFLWIYPWENWIGLQGLYIIPSVLIAGLLALPFIDRSPERDPRRRWLWIALGIIVFLAWLGLTIYGHVVAPAHHVMG
jgi:quinol-cytochrome oxidoreductase complex cytochrome b subunit